jgi:hypothetical protein
MAGLDDNRLLVYVSSYPLRPGPTCGQVNGPRVGRDPLHAVIQALEVPLGNPAAAHEIAEPPISYPGGPGQPNRLVRARAGGLRPGVLEPAARACHHIAVHVELRLAAAACAEQGQMWRVDENGIPDTAHPILIGDDEVSSGGTGNIPGAVDFFHSAIFSNDGSVANWVDESFAPTTGSDDCLPTTDLAARAWHPAGTHKTGRMFFSDLATGAFLSEFQVGICGPSRAPTARRTWGGDRPAECPCPPVGVGPPSAVTALPAPPPHLPHLRNGAI